MQGVELQLGETTRADTFHCQVSHKLDAAPFKPSINTKALTISSNAFKPDFAHTKYASPNDLDVEADFAGGCSSDFDLSDEGQLRSFEPAYKRKEKTELCKNWKQGLCKYGQNCAFAHGEEYLQKKTHVASKYKANLCNSFHSPPFVCLYGTRCQFVHLTRDFNQSSERYLQSSAEMAFEKSRMTFKNLLTENTTQMQIKLDNIAKPNLNTWNVALPSK
jgi:hypothetical protein